MNDLDIAIGRELQEKLCPDCREKLEAVITKKDLFRPKKLFKKVNNNTCEECKKKLFEASHDR